MKPNHLFRRVSLFTFGTCVIAGAALGDPIEAFEAIIFDEAETSYIEPYESNNGSVRNNIEFHTYNGGLLLHAGQNATSATASDGGISLWGNPVRIFLEGTGGNAHAASFEVSRGNAWQSFPATPIFKIDALTLNSTFTGSAVSINGGSLSVDGSPVLTSASAGGVLTGQNFVQLGSGGVLNIVSTTASTSNTTGAFITAGGIGVAKDSFINSIRIGQGGGNVNGNTVVGRGSLGNNSTGNANTAVGDAALMRNTTGYHNSAFGVDTLQFNTTGTWNSAIGTYALYANTGSSNVGAGSQALMWKAVGSNNTALGTYAGAFQANGTNLTLVNNSTYVGASTKASANAAYNETVIGSGAVGAGSNTTVIGNTSTTATYLKGETNSASLRVTGNTVLEGSLSVGGSAVLTAANAGSVLTGQNFVQLGSGGVLNIVSTTASTSSTTGAFTVAGGIGVAKDSYINGVKIGKGGGSVSNNTTFGTSSLENNTTGTANTSMGTGALMRNTTGTHNSSFGVDSLQYNTTGVWNTAMGANALYANTGNFNVGIGYGALYWNTNGSSNTAVGLSAGRRKADGAELTSVSNSIFIGTNTTASDNSDINSIVIGTGAAGAGSNTTVIGTSTTVKTYLKGETNSPSLRVAGNTVLEGDTVLEGQVTMAEAQGDISMGDYQ